MHFSGNAAGNAVEIGLAPKALAPLLGRTERELSQWLGGHAATRRERTVSGQRGSYPVGLAFGSHRDLAAFLGAWQMFRRGDGETASAVAAAPSALVAARIEKAALDGGFDRTPERHGGWLVIDYWQGRCAVTGLDVLPLLRASHIRPWAPCDSDAERLGVFNGLLLAPQLDALFDGGWISFDDDGGLLVSPELSGKQQVRLGVQPGWRPAELAAPHIGYLAWHRRQFFRR